MRLDAQYVVSAISRLVSIKKKKTELVSTIAVSQAESFNGEVCLKVLFMFCLVTFANFLSRFLTVSWKLQ